ncbi:cell division protein FtsL [Bacterioplanes sanyensis]|uniref:Cell division protein FtsL n=1 Tax=Bacterioplanes sanyensis TaxID=1249553 RepID=A0A222FDR0_9GAMM|nr:cell division protein FtsL [Bacterioplanes sanyensis]ASP37227.1 cell division protein FtsL [Bacterioplanes sanyensis]
MRLPIAAASVWMLVLVTALAQIVSAHSHRQWLVVWQQQDALRLQLLEEHTRLVLEKSTLTAHGRIDRLAREQLNMIDPQQIQVLVP